MVEEIHEMDGDGEPCGFMGVHIAGHVEDDVAIPLAWAWVLAEEEEVVGGFSAPLRIYVRKVPIRGAGAYRFVYNRKAGRGASPVTVVETARRRLARCHLCPWDAIAGIPVSRVIGAPADAQYVWLCKSHYTALGGDTWQMIDLRAPVRAATA
jgi:hypothetical protein